MTFTIYFSATHKRAFFLLRQEEREWAGPFYPDPEAAQRGIDQLIRRLRTAASDTITRVEHRASGYVLSPFGDAEVAVSSSPTFFTAEAARQQLSRLRRAAQEEQFSIEVKRLLQAPDLSTGDPGADWRLRASDAAAWQTVDTITLTVESDPAASPAEPGLATQPVSAISDAEPVVSPPRETLLPLLSPYQAADYLLFHGRERETEDIYQKTFDHRFLLIYGPARVGKTSLVRCGLANRVRPTRWQPLYIRRGAHIYASLVASLQEKVLSLNPASSALPEDPSELLLLLYELSAKPTYLIFDQFEELFLEGATPEEHAQLFDFLKRLLPDKRFPCQVILILREAHLARLGDFQEELPSLLEHRYHVQAPTKPVAISAVNNMLGTLHTQGKIRVQELGAVAEEICDQLANGQNIVYWHCLQIYLHELYQRARAQAKNTELPLFDPALIAAAPSAQKLIDAHIDDRVRAIKKRSRWKWISTDPAAARQLMELSESQVECSCSQPADRGSWWVLPIFTDLENELTRVWSLLWFTLAAILFIILLSLWPPPPPPPPPVCPVITQATTCEAWMDYLCAYGTGAACSRRSRPFESIRRRVGL